MPAQPRLTYNTALVLLALDGGHRYGFEIMELTGLPSGTVYPILRRLEAAGWLASDWEEDDEARAQGRPRRRYYVLAAPGREALTAAVRRFRLHQETFGDLIAGVDAGGEGP